MAAIVHPDQLSLRPALRLVPPLQPTRADYARRRLAVLLAALLVAVVAIRILVGVVAPSESTVSTRSPAAATPVTVHSPLAYGSTGTPVPDAAVYVVQPGDTVWSIAGELVPAGDVRGMVDRIVSLNGGAALEVGQHLRLS